MIRTAFIFGLIFSLLSIQSMGQGQSILKRDLQEEWLVHNDSNYIPFEKADKTVHTVYVSLPTVVSAGDYCLIESAGDFSIFLNNKFWMNASGSYKIHLDSLPTTQQAVMLAINQKEEITKENLMIKIFSEVKERKESTDEPLGFRGPTYFKDFVIVATLALFVFTIVIFQLNPRLSSAYFSFHKIFSLREIDDEQFYLRITSANILFYAFTSLVLGLFLMIVRQLTSIELNFLNEPASSFSDTLLAWIGFSLIIFSILFIKIILVNLIAFLFDCTDSAGYHFFNFMRVLLVVTTLITLVSIGYFMVHGTQVGLYIILFKCLGAGIGLYVIMLFFKLSNRVRFSPIHLFSYICATEIIPFFITIKVLYE